MPVSKSKTSWRDPPRIGLISKLQVTTFEVPWSTQWDDVVVVVEAAAVVVELLEVLELVEPAAEVVEVEVKQTSLDNGDFFCEAFFFSKASFSFSAEGVFFKALFSDETLLISEEFSLFEVS